MFSSDQIVAAARRFRVDRSGATAVLFAVALLPIALSVGAAVDYASAMRMRTMLTSSLDSAALSVAVAKASGQNVDVADAAVTQSVQKALQAALGPFAPNAGIVTTASIDSTGVLTATSQISMPTRIMRMIGIPSINLAATTRVAMPAGPVELAMVLDTTGSMAGAKIAALQAAATNLTNSIFAIPNAATNVKMAVVPFTDYVNIDLGNRNASWLTGAQDYTTPASGSCQDYPSMVCTGGYSTVNSTCTTDGVSSPCSWQQCDGYTQQGTYQWCPSAVTHSWHGCVGSRNYPSDVGAGADMVDSTNPVPAMLDYWCATPLQRLSGSKSDIQTAINNLSAAGETYIAPALLWGWRALSPYAPFADGAAYGSRTRKYIVLMTDGNNTHSPSYPGHDGNDTTTANDLTTQTCAAIKAKGVTLYAVAFQVTDPTIKSVLQSCATNASGYYDSASAADLMAAFQQIGAAITQVRIVN